MLLSADTMHVLLATPAFSSCQLNKVCLIIKYFINIYLSHLENKKSTGFQVSCGTQRELFKHSETVAD